MAANITYVQPDPKKAAEAAGIFLFGKMEVGEIRVTAAGKSICDLKLRIQAPPYEREAETQYWGTLVSTRWDVTAEEYEYLSYLHNQEGTVLVYGIGERTFTKRDGTEGKQLTAKRFELAFFFHEKMAYQTVRPSEPIGSQEPVAVASNGHGAPPDEDDEL